MVLPHFVALFVLSLYLGQFIGVELQPTTDEGQVTVREPVASCCSAMR